MDRSPRAEVTSSAATPIVAEVVRAVHAALGVGDLNALRELYTGADWAGQAHLLEQPSVRSDVLTVLRTHPANLGEGYVYPGFSTTGWVGPIDRTDATVLGLTPESLPLNQRLLWTSFANRREFASAAIGGRCKM
jgi:hypothetical protein